MQPAASKWFALRSVGRSRRILESLRSRPAEFDDQDEWEDGERSPPNETRWDDDPFADAEEAEPEYGDFWSEEDESDD